MYPLVQLGPFRLSSGGLVLLLALWLCHWLFVRTARRRSGTGLAEQADRAFFAGLIGAVIGGRIWYGLFNWDMYGQTPALFWALRVSDWVWPGALLGGALTAALWCHWRRADMVLLADTLALPLLLAQALASVGLLLSGEAFGVATNLPWAVPLFGTMRHPTQIYYALAALASAVIVRRVVQNEPQRGALTAWYFLLEGFALLLIEALRAESLVLLGGIRVTQLVGLGFILLALRWFGGIARSVASVRYT